MDSKKSILIVDDDEGICKILTLILERNGYETETSGTGRGAIEKARGRFFNVAILDIKLPDMEGVELLAPLKEMHPDMEMIMATGYASLETAVCALNEGASAYITKSMNMDEVLAKIRKVLEKQHLVMENRRLYQTAQQELARRMQAEEEKAKLEEQLRQSQKMEAIGQLTAGVAHNFNNMLMAIMGNIELAMIGDVPDNIKRYMKSAMTASQRAANIVKDLMLFARTKPLERNTVDINFVINDAVSICRKTFDRKIEFIVENYDNLPAVLGDFGELQQVFLNLCLNARDALEEVDPDSRDLPNIRIKVSQVGFDADNCLTLPEVSPGQYIRVSVSDNGIGMDKKTQERLFEPFFTTKKVGKGTGLGLATAYAILKRHHGWIDCQSQPGVGTTFNVYLPAIEQAIAIEKIKKEQEVTGGTETILLIEDEEMVRAIVQLMLEEHGYNVLLGVDGMDGLNIFLKERDKIVLVILDLSMPKMSGQEVLAKILALDTNVKVIIISGYNCDDFESIGAKAFIKKPIQQHKLLQTVREVLDN
jgi:signal transduction histidine kinase